MQSFECWLQIIKSRSHYEVMIWPQPYSKATCRDRYAVTDLAAEGVKRNGVGIKIYPLWRELVHRH